jgi:hypothetical protein
MDEPCNICGGPRLVISKGEDGKPHTERIGCLEHNGILGYLWNKHPDYKGHEIYRLNAARQQLGMNKI